MTLLQVYDKFNEIALKQPTINEIIRSGNVYDLSTERDTKFGVFAVVQGIHSSDLDNGNTTYNLTLYYIDRQKSDGSNRIEIQSTGMETLKNILRTFIKETDSELSKADYQVFVESFAQLCSGVYCTISIIVEDDNCTTIFD